MYLAKSALGHLELLNKVGNRHLSHHFLWIGTALREHESMGAWELESMTTWT